MLTIGIDIGGTTVSAGLVDNRNQIVRKAQMPTQADRGADDVIERIGGMVQALMAAAGISQAEHIGVGCAGMVDRATGEVIYSNNIDWHHVPLGRRLAERFHCPVSVDNDAMCATLGEFVAGAGKNVESMVMLTLGTGIGGGLVLHNRLYHGAHGTAGILGHMVVQKDGLACNCGKRGCFEGYASTSALIRHAEAEAAHCPDSLLAHRHPLDGFTFFEALTAEDPTAKRIFDAYTSDLAVGIGSLINILDPQMVVIGGGLSNEGERLLQPLREKVLGQLYCGWASMPCICAATLAGNAGIVGAAVLPRYQ